jgi:hypothetical protein
MCIKHQLAPQIKPLIRFSSTMLRQPVAPERRIATAIDSGWWQQALFKPPSGGQREPLLASSNNVLRQKLLSRPPEQPLADTVTQFEMRRQSAQKIDNFNVKKR